MSRIAQTMKAFSTSESPPPPPPPFQALKVPVPPSNARKSALTSITSNRKSQCGLLGTARERKPRHAGNLRLRGRLIAEDRAYLTRPLIYRHTLDLVTWSGRACVSSRVGFREFPFSKHSLCTCTCSTAFVPAPSCSARTELHANL